MQDGCGRMMRGPCRRVDRQPHAPTAATPRPRANRSCRPFAHSGFGKRSYAPPESRRARPEADRPVDSPAVMDRTAREVVAHFGPRV